MEADWADLGNGNCIEFLNAPPRRQGECVDIPLGCLTPIVVEVLRRGLLSRSETTEIFAAAHDALVKRNLKQDDGAYVSGTS